MQVVGLIEIADFTRKYLEEATLLFTSGYRQLRSSIPWMPRCHENPAAIVPLLAELAVHNAGAVALSDGKIVGYLLGMLLPEFKSPFPGVYCPEWAHAVAPANEDMVYTALFQYLAPSWVRAGAVSFAVTILARYQPAIDDWFWNGFGLAVIDAVRPPTPIEVSVPSDLLIRQTTGDDLAAITALLADHNRYMSRPPVSLAMHNDISPECLLDRINRPGHTLWLAERTGKAVGIL